MEEQEINKSSGNGVGNSSLSTDQNPRAFSNPRKSSLDDEERKLLSARILDGKKKKKVLIKSILRRHSNTMKDRNSARSLTSMLSRKVSFARNKLDLEKVKYFMPDSAENIESGDSSESLSQVQMLSIEEDKGSNNEVSTTQLASSLFSASKEEGGLNDMIRALRNGASARGSENEKPLDEIKKQIGRIEMELKNAKEPERCNVLERIHNEFKLKNIVLKIYKEAELCLDLARHVRGLKTIEFSPLAADDLYKTSTTEDSANFVYAQIFIDNFLVEPQMPMIPFSSKINWQNMGGNCPNYFVTFDIKTDAKYRPTRSVRVDLMKGRPSAVNEVKLGSWEKRLLDIDKVLKQNPHSSNIITSELQCTDYLMEGAYMDVGFKKAPRDENTFRRKRYDILKKIGEILGWITNFQKDPNNAGSSNLINADISYFGNTSLLHAAVYLYDSALVQCLLDAGADVARRSINVGTASDLCGNLMEESRRRKDGLEEEYRQITTILKGAKAIAIRKHEARWRKSNISIDEETNSTEEPEHMIKGVPLHKDMKNSHEAKFSRHTSSEQHHLDKGGFIDKYHETHESEKNLNKFEVLGKKFDKRASKPRGTEDNDFDSFRGSNIKNQHTDTATTGRSSYQNGRQYESEESYASTFGLHNEFSSYNVERSMNSEFRSRTNVSYLSNHSYERC